MVIIQKLNSLNFSILLIFLSLSLFNFGFTNEQIHRAKSPSSYYLKYLKLLKRRNKYTIKTLPNTAGVYVSGSKCIKTSPISEPAANASRYLNNGLLTGNKQKIIHTGEYIF